MVRQDGKPLITGDSNWVDRGMYFAAADEGTLPIGFLLNYVVANSDFVYQPTYRNEDPIGKIKGRDVFTKFAIAEGEHPFMTQVTVAREYASMLNRLCKRMYGEGFRVGGQKG